MDDNYNIVSWYKGSNIIAGIANECELSKDTDLTYTYTCDLAKHIYYLIIPPDAITDGIQNVAWRCNPVLGTGSYKWSLTLSGTYGV